MHGSIRAGRSISGVVRPWRSQVWLERGQEEEPSSAWEKFLPVCRKMSPGCFHPERNKTLVVTKVAEEGRNRTCHQLGRSLIFKKVLICSLVGGKKKTTVKQRAFI